EGGHGWGAPWVRCSVRGAASLSTPDLPGVVASLTASEYRGALFVESGETLRVIIGGAQLTLGDVLLLHRFPQSDALITQILDEGTAGEECAGGTGGCLVGSLPGDLQELVSGDGTGEQTGLHRLRTGDEIPGDNEVHGAVRTETLEEEGMP